MRPIKSFVLRAGRMSPSQRLGLAACLPDYCLPLGPTHWDFSRLFGRQADIVVEIGFGMGQSFLATASASPDVDFIGIEVHQAGIGSLARALREQGLSNVRIAPYDAVTVMEQAIPAASLAGVQIFFPDPWPKARHHKRRLIQAPFVRLLVDKIKPGGFLHLATDWDDYALHMQYILSCEPSLKAEDPLLGNIAQTGGRRPLTKFEQRGLQLGHSIWDLYYIRQSNAACTKEA